MVQTVSNINENTFRKLSMAAMLTVVVIEWAKDV